MNEQDITEKVAKAVFDPDQPSACGRKGSSGVGSGYFRDTAVRHRVSLSVNIFGENDLIVRLKPEVGEHVETVLPLYDLDDMFLLETAWTMRREVIRRNCWGTTSDQNE